MNLLVTGGCGFIGTNFVRFVLTRHPDWRIVNLDALTYAGNRHNLADLEAPASKDRPSRYAFVHGDIGDLALVEGLIEEHRIEAVVNFAAESHVDRSITAPDTFVRTNVLGTQAVLEACRRAKVRLVHISTDEVYGSLGPSDHPFLESTPLTPNSPYSASKAGADLLVRAYHETYGLDAVITRCSNNYGPYQFPEKLIPLMYVQAKAGQPLPVYGDGQNVRDWIYVDDHCLGVELALTKGRPGAVYNFGGAAERANLEVVRAILDTLGQPHSLIRFVTDRPGHDRRYAMDFTLAEQELGFAPTVSFEQGLARTMVWYQANAAWLAQVQSGEYRRFMDQWYGDRT